MGSDTPRTSLSLASLDVHGMSVTILANGHVWIADVSGHITESVSLTASQANDLLAFLFRNQDILQQLAQEQQ